MDSREDLLTLILGFTESKDIREHCIAIGWEPTPVEAAYIVWQSQMQPMRDRHAAWKKIIELMPNETTGYEWDWTNLFTLHELLQRYMELENRLLEELCEHNCSQGAEQKEGYWTCDVEHDIKAGRFSESRRCWARSGSAVAKGLPCRSFKEATERFGVLRGEDPACWDDTPSYAIFTFPDAEYVTSYLVSRRSFGVEVQNGGSECDENMIQARFSKKFEPIKVLRAPDFMGFEDTIVWDSFPSMHFDIPTPWRTGDILHYVAPWENDRKFILVDMGDESDMDVSGCEVDARDGWIEIISPEFDYLHMERYKGDLEGYERKLKPLGDFMAGRIGLRECFRLCREIELDSERNQKVANLNAQCSEIGEWFGFDALAEDYASLESGKSWLSRY